MLPVKIWRISQTANSGYDTYDAAIVAADSADAARFIHPASILHQRGPLLAAVDGYRWRSDGWCSGPADPKSEASAVGLGHPLVFESGDWAHPSEVDVEFVGEAADGVEAGAVLVASYNAG